VFIRVLEGSVLAVMPPALGGSVLVQRVGVIPLALGGSVLVQRVAVIPLALGALVLAQADWALSSAENSVRLVC
jgi:hypothetical protein